MQESFVIKTSKGKRSIGPGRPVFIIAEMSANHGHDVRKAFKIIDAAAKAGVDAIKLQTYTADTITLNSEKKYFQAGSGHKIFRTTKLSGRQRKKTGKKTLVQPRD